MITKTAMVASLFIASGRGGRMFNDRLADGTRSLKVVGWNSQDYTEAKLLLEKMGCTVITVTTADRGATRLHVVE